MLQYIYLCIVAFLMALILRGMLRERDVLYQLDAALVLIPLALRLLLIK